jgi:DNA-binding SARP family transcriptional activator
VLALATYFSNHGGDARDLRTLALSLAIVVPPGFLIFVEPDLGTAIVFICIWLGVVLVAGDVSLGALLFVPLNLLRIEDRPRLFSALAIMRHALNAGLKVWFLSRGAGVEGVLWGDLLSTGALVLAALPLLRGRATPALSRTLPFRIKEWPWPFRIQTLGRFDLQRSGAPVEASAKGPGRPLELLKVLIALGGQSLRADQLADALWPHAEADYAHKSFTATLHRLRRLLGTEEALLLRDARLSMNRSLLWVDTWALEQTLSELDETLRAPAPASLDVAAKLMDEVFALYRGPFLPDESEQPAYIAYREQLRARLLRCLVRVARVWEDTGRGDAAVDGYLRCVEADPLFEAPYRNLMLCYQRAGDAAEARATYERLRAILSTRMKTLPSQETQAVFAALAAPGGR